MWYLLGDVGSINARCWTSLWKELGVVGLLLQRRQMREESLPSVGVSMVFFFFFLESSGSQWGVSTPMWTMYIELVRKLRKILLVQRRNKQFN